MVNVLESFEPVAKKISNLILQQEYVEVVAHIDADGICSAAIASGALDNAGIEHTITFLKQIDEEALESLKHRDNFVWFVDLGSGVYEELKTNFVISDHHIPASKDMERQLNPHLLNIDGSREMSGAGATYIVARSMSDKNRSLAPLAIVGAVGDMQDNEECRLIGTNRELLAESGVEVKKDIRYFGRESRPVYKLLQYASDPVIPGVSGFESTTIKFLQSLNVELKDGEKWRRWVDLTFDERKKIISEIVKIVMRKGFGAKRALRVVGEVYLLPNEKGNLHDAKEYATLLNACGRHGAPEVGVAVCLGDRDVYYRRAMSLLNEHRSAIANGMERVKEIGIEPMEHIVFFDAGDKIDERIVGIVAGMVLEANGINKPIIAFAKMKDKDMLKVSARANHELVERGVDLSKALNNSAKLVGGIGGGHKMAAGASVPREKKEDFLKLVDEEIARQLGVFFL
jgi:RecJ-like exonuclease